ncbi:MAG: phosphoribosylaminoimidazolesuccinocarboxamide synthase [Bacteroidales bacterium]|jgi:phosphoribosylaminoimidazole-succinocarboxamide synthase|nr:phosphoribosylaminoimidazolesuccinocarboxamide synthase [Bacteroidales bacterium]MCI2122038.1 phosphoribosylaminoimidazolesuccinocarboxamide synthase [Bacteroidales bacterium]MCI2145335.1 phosphoribosylaminoimidazolesuccinocarboxamide synthase [Bacteroidales bacterium]
MEALTNTSFNFPNQDGKYVGKVRDVYSISDKYLAMVVTDRISAFDVVLPKGIPYKGQVLNQTASLFLDKTSDIIPNWKIDSPDPMVTVGYKCRNIPVEFIVRGYLAGSAWRAYKSGVREICGIRLPEGMRQNEKFTEPILTPTTKAKIGTHDEDISGEDIVKRGILDKKTLERLSEASIALFKRGNEIASDHGLILVDTKYEFGEKDGNPVLIDEIHTPDSSRYYYSSDYMERFESGLEPRQLSKEFVREWLMDNGFSGQKGQRIPEMTPEKIEEISDRYIELYENVTGCKFLKAPYDNIGKRIEENVNGLLSKL